MTDKAEKLRAKHEVGEHRTKIVDGCPICEQNLIELDKQLAEERREANDQSNHRRMSDRW